MRFTLHAVVVPGMTLTGEGLVGLRTWKVSPTLKMEEGAVSLS